MNTADSTRTSAIHCMDIRYKILVNEYIMNANCIQNTCVLSRDVHLKHTIQMRNTEYHLVIYARQRRFDFDRVDKHAIAKMPRAQ